MVQFRDGPWVPHGPDATERAIEAWVAKHQLEPAWDSGGGVAGLDVYVHRDEEAGVVVIVQLSDVVAVPIDDFGRFLEALANRYTGGEA